MSMSILSVGYLFSHGYSVPVKTVLRNTHTGEGLRGQMARASLTEPPQTTITNSYKPNSMQFTFADTH